jgi:hypothetical protein
VVGNLRVIEMQWRTMCVFSFSAGEEIMRRSAIVMGVLAAIFGLVFASGAHADRGGEMLRLALVGDADGDGIPDEEDNCVDVANEDQAEFDGDGVGDVCDNCSERVNALQDDTDDDSCGNICDADYNQDGIVDWGDWGSFVDCFNWWDDCLDRQHVEPIGPGQPIDFGDFGYFSAAFGAPPGPSGTTPGIVACPIWER